jgi:hypothetical protein
MKNKHSISTLVLIFLTSLSFSQEAIISERITPVENGLTGFNSAVYDGWALVASPQQDISDKQSVGSVTFFKQTNAEWKVAQTVFPENPSSLANFGMSVAIEGTTAVISAIGDHEGGLFSGAVYVYNYDYLEGLWIQTAKLKASDTGVGKRFGHSVTIQENMIVVGAYNADGHEAKSGAAYIFKKDELGNWQEEQKIYATAGLANDYFGHQVHILDATNIAVGAYNADGHKERSGAVYIFNKVNGVWTQKAKLFDAEGASSDLFGFSLSSGPRNTSSTSSGYPGILFIGAPGTNDEQLGQTGSVYFYVENVNGWEQSTELIEEGSNHNDHFGVSVSCNEKGNLFVGANRANNNTNTSSGKVYVYDTFSADGSAVSGVELSTSLINSYDHYGSNVVSHKEHIIIGSPYADTEGLTNSGKVNFFRMGSVIDSETDIEALYSLHQNVPNPSASGTVIEFQIKQAGWVKLSVYDITGKLVSVLVDEIKGFGYYTIPVNSSLLSKGVYLYKIEVNDFTATKKMIIGE